MSPAALPAQNAKEIHDNWLTHSGSHRARGVIGSGMPAVTTVTVSDPRVTLP